MKTVNNMITKNIKQYLFAGSVCCLTATFTACNDFLDILPTNAVVLENFWTEKEDVTSVVSSCYESMLNNDVMTRMGVWGELRSDNIAAGSNVPNNINEILKENLLPTNDLCNWARFYEIINRCNTVCHYAPQVQAIDPNYTEEEMRANVAEAVTLRALSYFYLIRTFRDVPYVTQPSIDDTQEYAVAASPFNVVLDSLIQDLERVKNDAVRRYYTDESSMAYVNSSKVTRWTVYALLADLYLWKGDWDNAIAYCDLVIDYKRSQYDEMLARKGQLLDLDLIDGVPMILEKPVGSTLCGNAYSEIFGTGNSFESIFELNFRNSVQTNNWVSSYYGNSTTKVANLSCPDFLASNVAEGNNALFKRTDGRIYANTELDNSRYGIAKYVHGTVTYDTKSVSDFKSLNLHFGSVSSSSANWIIYRLSDMLLIKAEAMVERNQGTDLADAFKLVDIVNKRANDAVGGTRSSTLKPTDYVDSQRAMEDLVLDERQREFLFEGKRWYDLVRYSRRDGNTNRLASHATKKLKENVTSTKIKLADPNIIYFPYYKNELKVNPLLKQNPAFSQGEDSELNR